MPVVLNHAAHSLWLDPGLKDSAQAIELALRNAETEFSHYPVSRRVNIARNDEPSLIEPLPVLARS